MSKSANTFFFLSAVSAHINADVFIHENTTTINFTHNRDFLKSCELSVKVKKTPAGFVVAYVMEKDGVDIQQSASLAISGVDVYGVITALANDAFPVDA